MTMILRELSERQEFIVFKGGTSLSKCHKAIKRFSEDIDITIDSKLTQGQMKKLKESIKAIAGQLGLSIPNIDDTRSRRSYNRYILEYQSVLSEPDDAVQTAVLMEMLVPDPGKQQYERRSDNSWDFRGKYGLRNVCKLVIIKLRSKIIV